MLEIRKDEVVIEDGGKSGTLRMDASAEVVLARKGRKGRKRRRSVVKLAT